MKAEVRSTLRGLQIKLLPESKSEQEALRAMYRKGHAHFLCEHVEYADAGRLVQNPLRSLRLEHSLIEWSRPESKLEKRKRRRR